MEGQIMAALAEQDSDKAARILAAARELVLKRGVKGLTVAEIAQKAHVAKGTVYLHWETREDLLVGVFARDFMAALDDCAAALTAEADLCRPHRFLPWIIRAALDHPFVRALHIGDDDLLGVLTQHPRSAKLRDELGPAALMYNTLPVWRRHRLVRTDWPLDDQAYALQALTAGFVDAATRTRVLPGVTVDAPDRVIAASVTALLGPDQASPEDVRAAAEDGLRMMAEKRELVLASIAKSE
jgi:AcrR family transcriptional regulator